MMDSQRHARAKELFLEALSTPNQERATLLERQCGGDALLRREVLDLLSYADDGDDYTISAKRGKLEAGLAASAVSRVEPAKYERGHVFAERYRIVGLLGQGAMGDVYRAFDTTLDVEVALKLIHDPDPSLIERLQEEVRLAREVTHPAICRVYDIGEHHGEHFLTMEFVEGEDLRELLSRLGKLAADDVYTIALQLCEGLVAAHGHGVLHRDLKPSNIILDSNGKAVIADFGIATTTGNDGDDSIAGTPAYMAPEILADGAAASEQSDFFALGVLLYELATGERIAGERDIEEIASKARSLASRVPDLDSRLTSLVAQMLEGNPDKRPRSAEEALRGLTSTTATRRDRSIRRAIVAGALAAAAVVVAVVAFDHAQAPRETVESSVARSVERLGKSLPSSGVASAALVRLAFLGLDDTAVRVGNPHLANAIRDEIIDGLSARVELDVITGDAMDRFSAGGGTAESVGVELGADYIVRGRVERDDGDILISVRLADAQAGGKLWSRVYRAPLHPEGLRAMEHDLVDQLAVAVQAHRRSKQRARRTKSVGEGKSADADTLWRRADRFANPWTKTKLQRVTKMLRRAIALDPEHARSFASLASALVLRADRGWSAERRGSYDEAEVLARRALSLDESLLEPHVTSARVFSVRDWNWARAESAHLAALERDPESNTALNAYAEFLSFQGRFDAAIEHALRAVDQDATSALTLRSTAARLYEARSFERAAALARLASVLDDTDGEIFGLLAMIALERGEYEDAIANSQRLIPLMGRNADTLARLAYTHHRAGDQDQAYALSSEAAELGTMDVASRLLAALATDRPDDGIAALDDALRTHDPLALRLEIDPVIDPLRAHPSYSSLSRRLGMPVGLHP